MYYVFTILMWVCMMETVWAQTDSQLQNEGRIRYVKENGSGDGSSWENASGDLQAMINASTSGDKVYVTAGTYYAKNGNEIRDERNLKDRKRQRAFVMKGGVSVYGGFDPLFPEAHENERAYLPHAKYGWQLKHVSVLTGESDDITDNWELDTIGWKWKADGYLDNTTHVVWFASNGFSGENFDGEVSVANALEQPTLLDGFTIEGGYADGCGRNIPGSSARFGGGIYLVKNGIVQNCIISENYAVTRGGGVFMNYGGRVSDCFISRNTCPGYNLVRNGLGGGVYIVGEGVIERSFVVNNNARRGGGIYLEKEHHVRSYDAVVEMSVIANNTASNEGGGVYCDSTGVLTGTWILRNNCMDPGLTGNGKTGGIFIDQYAVLTAVGIYGNTASMSARQGYAINIDAPEEAAKKPSSVQIVYSAIEQISAENFGMSTLKEVVNIDDRNHIYASRFLKNLETVGLVPTALTPAAYLDMADWDKDPCSVFVLRGVSTAEAPYLSEVEAKRVNIPAYTIDRKQVARRMDIGPYISDLPEVQHGNLPDGTAVVYVDNHSVVCGDGSSWSNPTRLLVPAIQHIAAVGGGQVWVKEGNYLPLYSETGTNPQEYCVNMKGNVVMYGGFPQSQAAPLMEDRDPVTYRTVIDGDIGIKGDYTDNSYHLVIFDNTITEKSVLDGFVLRNSNSLPDPHNSGKGGAILVKSSKAEIRNCIIENCLALEGAAVWAEEPFWIENCVVNNNDARGGAVVMAKRGSELINLTVVLNKGIGISGGNIVNTLVWGNSGITNGEGIQINDAESVTYSAIQGGGFPDPTNVVLELDFEGGLEYLMNPTKVAGMVLQGYGTVHGGPAHMEPMCTASSINRGKESEKFSQTDIRGVKRGRGGAWDIGAFEGTCMPESGVWYVREGGAGKKTGTSWDDASDDLMAMLERAQPGEQVWVAAGTYQVKTRSTIDNSVTGKNGKVIPRYRYVNFKMKEGVDVYGGFPAWGTPSMKERRPGDISAAYRTILEALPVQGENKSGRVLEQEGDFETLTTWDGFTIRNGYVEIDDGEDGGAGVKLWKNGRLENCYITGNVNKVTEARYERVGIIWGRWEEQPIYLRGGGVHCRGGSLVNCYITHNKVVVPVGTTNGGGHEAYGGGLYMRNGTVYNSVIVNNECEGYYADGCAAFVEQADFYNNTIAYNRGVGRASSALRIGGFMEDSKLQIMNCIVALNQCDKAIASPTEGYKVITYSFFAGEIGEANINGTDPMFKDPTNGDFRLAPASPCINSGNTYPTGIELPETDMDYTERIKDCAIDIGAYEFGEFGEGTIVPDISRPDTAVVYVTMDGRGKADGSSWDQAACGGKLQRAINVLASHRAKVRQVWVGTGKVKNTGENRATAEFCPVTQWEKEEIRSRSFRIRSGVEVIGCFVGIEKSADERKLSESIATTLLSGDFNYTRENTEDDAFHVVVFDTVKMGEISLLESFVVRSGNANHYDREEYQNGGGVVIRPGANLRNCAITACKAIQKGGGVYLADKPEEYANRMPGAMITGCLVKGCEAGTGGGIYAGRRSIITNSTIVQNQANMGGGLAFTWPAAIQGSVLWNNTAENGKDIYGVTDVPFEHGYEAEAPIFPEKVYPVNFSAIEGLHIEGQFNLKLSSENEGEGLCPAFVDPVSGTIVNKGWGLKSNSALIDKGLNHAIFMIGPEELLKYYWLSDRDLGGNKRIHSYYASSGGGYMDIGAYELNEEIRLQPDEHNRIYVTRSARGRMDGSSWKNATSNLQSALDYFKDKPRRGEVWVQGGYTYIPMRLISEQETDPRATSFVLNPQVDLYGSFMGDTINEPEIGRISESSLEERPRLDRNKNNIYEEYEFRYETVLNAEVNPIKGYDYNGYHILYYDNTTTSNKVVIDGFTFENGQAVCGKDFRHGRGGAIYATAPVCIRNCIFLDNYAAFEGGAVYSSRKGEIRSCLFGTNGISVGNGGAVYMKDGIIANTIVTNNTARYGKGGGVYLENGKVVNSVIASNNAQEAAGIYLQTAEAINTVIWNNAIQTPTVAEIGGNGKVSHCAFPLERKEGNLEVVGCVSLNSKNNAPDGPHFIHPTTTSVTEAYDWAADWRIHTLSPLSDEGDGTAYKLENLPLTVNYVQYAGNKELAPIQRIQGNNIDIGCYETSPVRLADRDTLYVRTWEDPTVIADGSSWKNATSDLQAAIEKLESRPSLNGVKKQIWVAQGVYVPMKERQSGNMASRSFVFQKGGIEIYGGFPDDGVGNINPTLKERQPSTYVTILDGSPTRSYHVVYGIGTSGIMLWDGFTITGGEATGGGEEGTGAAVYVNVEAYLCFLKHCVITKNKASGNGGAVFARSRLSLSNCLIHKNEAVGLRTSFVEMLNTTVAANKKGGAIIADYSANPPFGYVRNSVFWGNENLQLWVGSTPVTYCGVQDTVLTGMGNIELNAINKASEGPHFMNPNDTTFNGFELGCGSILRDKGDSEGIGPEDVDLRGEPRILYGIVDIGALESTLDRTPRKPEIGEKDVFTCQYEKKEIPLTNDVPYTKLYAYSEGWEIPLNDTLIIGAERPGNIEYEIVRMDSTGCISDADTLVAHVYSAVAPQNFTGTSQICEGDDAMLTFTPIAGYTYELFEGENALPAGSYVLSKGQVQVLKPGRGSHSYKLRAKMVHGETECISDFTAPFEVTVLEGRDPDGSVLKLIENTNTAGTCEGEEIKIVYEYANSSGMKEGVQVFGLPSEVKPQLETSTHRIIISGRPTTNFTYTVKVEGEVPCATARETGVVQLNPKPVFQLKQ